MKRCTVSLNFKVLSNSLCHLLLQNKLFPFQKMMWSPWQQTIVLKMNSSFVFSWRRSLVKMERTFVPVNGFNPAFVNCWKALLSSAKQKNKKTHTMQRKRQVFQDIWWQNRGIVDDITFCFCMAVIIYIKFALRHMTGSVLDKMREKELGGHAASQIEALNLQILQCCLHF